MVAVPFGQPADSVTCDTTLAWTDQWWLYLLAGPDFLQEPAWARA